MNTGRPDPYDAWTRRREEHRRQVAEQNRAHAALAREAKARLAMVGPCPEHGRQLARQGHVWICWPCFVERYAKNVQPDAEGA